MEKFYITTPVYYATSGPHIGHAFTTIIADVIARWNRISGKDVFFLVGTDEHGSKIEKAAKEANMAPQEFVDKVASEYDSTWKALNISYDKFIRTTDKAHEDAVKTFVSLVWDNEDIYKSKYEGWYCLPDETFILESELKDGKCPQCGRPVQRISEDAYFFSLSRYRDTLLSLFDSDSDFVIPKARANEIKNILLEGLKDVDITRKSVAWGIKFPFDEEQTIYVWFDALINYISALGWPDGSDFVKYWPADVHLVGKEITRFHALLWPAMLLSAGIDLPTKIVSHGWWTVNGQKMSKSLGNVLNPVDLVKKYSADALRYFLIREKPMWEDGDFSEKALVAKINGELLADLGNLVARVLTLAEKFTGHFAGDAELSSHLNLSKITEDFSSYDVNAALNDVWSFVRSVNKYINDKEPWKLKDVALGKVLNESLEALRIISILIYPFMPASAEKIANQLGIKIGTLNDCKFGKFIGNVKRGQNLFDKVELSS